MIRSRRLRPSRIALVFGLVWTLVGAGCGREAPSSPSQSTSRVSTADGMDPLARNGNDRWVDKDRKKLPPGLFRDLDTVPAPESLDPIDSRAVMVELDGLPSQGVFRANGATIVEEYPEIGMVKVISVHGMAAEQLAHLLIRKAGVLSAEPDHYLKTPESQGMPISFNDGEFDRDDTEHQDFLERLHVPEAHALSLGRGTRVAILDNGVDPDHPALSGRIRGRDDLVDRDATPWETADGVDNDGDGMVDEALGHGTHVTGLIAMLAPEAELDIYRVLNDEGWGTASDVAKAILNAVKDGADVINLSLGMYDPFRAVEKALDYATARGVVVIGAAGNDGVSDPGQYPASFPQALGVGSADCADRLSTFSNFGPSIHVTAPGEQVLSTFPGGGYASATGTSMSSAIVSALAALILEQHGGIERDGARADDVAGRIARASATGTGLPGLTGHGRVDFLEAVRN